MDDLISRLSELRSQYNLFDENEQGAYHTLSEAIAVLNEVNESAQPTQTNTPNTLEALDCISRKDAVDIINGYAEQFNGYIGTPNDSEVYAYARGLLLSIERNISALTSAQPEIVRCKDCKYFEYDHLCMIQGVPVLGHLVCIKWGNGCRTDEDGFCFMGERKDG